jgi:hypothetical protein
VASNSVFIEFVQLHERQWGVEQYPGRPSLADLVQYPIVAMWLVNEKRSPAAKRATPVSAEQERFMLTAHRNYEELDELATNSLLSGSTGPTSNWKLVKVFVDQKPVKICARIQIIDG